MLAAREHWGSRFGFIMATAGSAIGLGNIWRFPYTAGENGGSAFILIYLAVVVSFGISLVMAEMVLGRTTQRNPVGAFRALGGHGWAFAGGLGVLTGFVILSFYVVVAGWTLAYMVFMATGQLATTDPAILGTHFGQFTGQTFAPILAAALFMALTAWIVSGGIGKGIERASKVLMPLLFVLLLLLVLRAVTLPGAGEGIAFLLTPDFSKVTGQTFISATAQAFFSLSIGMGVMITYGSYLQRDSHLPRSTLIIVLLDVSVAVLAALMILPAVFAVGLDPSAGPGLTFITLPAVFASLPFGNLLGVLFFALLAIAALTSAVSILEPMVAWAVDERGLSRRGATWVAAAVCLLLAVPASLSFGPLSEATLAGRTFFDWMDFLANTVMLPLGGLLVASFIGWRWAAPACQALSNDSRLTLPWLPAWILLLRFAAPVAIVAMVWNAFTNA
jgi:neurotransmitter:Na+ symporter, NSS family